MKTGPQKIPALQVDLSTYKDEILAEIGKVIDSGQLTLGPYTLYIEQRWAADHGKEFGIAVNSDTAALECVLQLMDIKDRLVLMPQTAFFACANIVLRLGGIVGLVDITPSNGIMPTYEQWTKAIDFFRERRLDPKVAMLVYSAGQCSPTQVRDILNLQEEMFVLEDCAHCHGGKYADGRFIGSAGDFATWSTYATKLIHSGEGGMIVTNDRAAAEAMRVYRAYGRKANDGVFTECVSPKGYNWRITEMQAAILKVMWSHLPEIIQARRNVAEVYDAFFPQADGDYEGGQPYSLVAKDITRNLYRYTVMIPGMTFESNRSLYTYLREECDPIITLQEKSNHMPLAMHSGYAGHPRVLSAPRQFPGAMQYCLEHICLPIYPKMRIADAEFIAKCVNNWWNEWRKSGKR
jgi:perosamine synthetase